MFWFFNLDNCVVVTNRVYKNNCSFTHSFANTGWIILGIVHIIYIHCSKLNKNFFLLMCITLIYLGSILQCNWKRIHMIYIYFSQRRHNMHLFHSVLKNWKIVQWISVYDRLKYWPLSRVRGLCIILTWEDSKIWLVLKCFVYFQLELLAVIPHSGIVLVHYFLKYHSRQELLFRNSANEGVNILACRKPRNFSGIY